jgi:hypothetical protein
MVDREAAFGQFDQDGEALTRAQVAGYYNPEWAGFAREWLAIKDQEREALRDASNADSLDVARSAKNAAWAAAIAAMIAAAITIAVAVISYLSWASPHAPH